MANIRVETKKKTPIWPWIVGVVLLLGIIWLVVEAFDDEGEYQEQWREEVDEAEVEDEVNVQSAEENQYLVIHAEDEFLAAGWQLESAA